jgi:hypothetical protein
MSLDGHTLQRTAEPSTSNADLGTLMRKTIDHEKNSEDVPLPFLFPIHFHDAHSRFRDKDSGEMA